MPQNNVYCFAFSVIKWVRVVIKSFARYFVKTYMLCLQNPISNLTGHNFAIGWWFNSQTYNINSVNPLWKPLRKELVTRLLFRRVHLGPNSLILFDIRVSWGGAWSCGDPRDSHPERDTNIMTEMTNSASILLSFHVSLWDQSFLQTIQEECKSL